MLPLLWVTFSLLAYFTAERPDVRDTATLVSCFAFDFFHSQPPPHLELFLKVLGIGFIETTVLGVLLWLLKAPLTVYFGIAPFVLLGVLTGQPLNGCGMGTYIVAMLTVPAVLALRVMRKAQGSKSEESSLGGQ
jgi:hypothetical protein